MPKIKTIAGFMQLTQDEISNLFDQEEILVGHVIDIGFNESPKFVPIEQVEILGPDQKIEIEYENKRLDGYSNK